jgi:hypothetical protein
MGILDTKTNAVAFATSSATNAASPLYPRAVIQVDQKGRSQYDAPNRFLFWSDIQGPWKLNILPVCDLHTGFPYTVQNEFRDYIGPRSSERFPQFSSTDLQITRPFTVHFRDKGLTCAPAAPSSTYSTMTIPAMFRTFATVPGSVPSTTMHGENIAGSWCSSFEYESPSFSRCDVDLRRRGRVFPACPNTCAYR